MIDQTKQEQIINVCSKDVTSPSKSLVTSATTFVSIMEFVPSNVSIVKKGFRKLVI